jgi:hypothetical protein
LKAGDHEIGIEYFRAGGEPAAKRAGRSTDKKRSFPAQVLFHRPANDKGHAQIDLKPGLIGEYFDLGESPSDFPDLAINDFDGPLLRELAATQLARRTSGARRYAAAARLKSRIGTLQVSGVLSRQKESPLLRVTAASF